MINITDLCIIQAYTNAVLWTATNSKYYLQNLHWDAANIMSVYIGVIVYEIGARKEK